MSEAVRIAMPGEFAANSVMAEGSGSPVVYLHGPYGQRWDGYLSDLAEGGRRVYAPEHPGAERPEDLMQLDSLSDLVLYYDDLFEALKLKSFDLVGHSFGGMVAAEIAATLRQRVHRLVLIDPLGLWRDDAPVADYLVAPPAELGGLLFHDLDNPEVKKRIAEPEDLAAGQEATVRRMSAIASTTHFVWPIPDRGLSRRLRRIVAPTLVLWGRQDRVVDVSYAKDFAAALPDAKVEVFDGAGHYPQLEQRAAAAKATLDFLRG
ncbi:MAG TPA: alpha/beta fold hydrolase [Bradyrhizobium sp.]|nr:alpha/beta fold hydrolase [Bradyrhizobium sp.]